MMRCKRYFLFLCVVCVCIRVLGWTSENEGGIWTKRVYLATYPRSGNHWVRYLIEEVTHVATSSVYCDASVGRAHSGEPLPWGGYSPKYGYEGTCRYPMPNDIVVVKTHFPAVPAQPFDRRPYMKTIRIARHPVDSLYSFFVFSGKRSETSSIPIDLLMKRVKTWKKFHEYWNQQSNVVTVRYEELLNNPCATLKIILEAIGIFATDTEIEKAVAKYPPQGCPMKHIHRFTKEDLELIQQELGELMHEFHYVIPKINGNFN